MRNRKNKFAAIVLSGSFAALVFLALMAFASAKNADDNPQPGRQTARISQILGPRDENQLGDLFVLDQLFERNGSNLSLGDLFVLDRLFRQSSVILNPDSTTIGDLLILNQLFGGSVQ